MADNINPVSSETNLAREWFREACVVRGYRVRVHRLIESNKDHEHDPSPTFEPVVELRALFEEFPNRKILKGLGWWTEKEDTLPSLMYLPATFTDPVNGDQPLIPHKYTRVEVLYDVVGMEQWRPYIVMENAANAPEVHYWAVKLVPDPIKTTFSEPADPKSDNYKYLDLDE